MVKKKYPKILIVHNIKIKAEDDKNLLLRTQFGDWPKKNLAQIHAQGETIGLGTFCDKYYCLQKYDRCFGSLFLKMRSKVFAMIKDDKIAEKKVVNQKVIISKFSSLLKKNVGELMTKSGLWEILFFIRMSAEMECFIRDFMPDVIYCQGYSLGFTILPLLISKKFNVPIFFQTTDDWPMQMYRFSPAGWLLRKKARELIEFAKIRLVFGEKMKIEYERRYGVVFNVSYHLDDKRRFIINNNTSIKDLKIIYTGGLSHRRYEAFIDLLNVIFQIPILWEKIEIIIYTNNIPKDIPKKLLQSKKINYAPLPSHDRLPTVLAEAALLLLPESFNEDRKAIEYSISTKAHLYMMSQRPILVYGPQYSGTVNYAINYGWGFVVSERNEKKLKEALLHIFSKNEQSQKIDKANRCLRENHDLEKGRKKIQALMSNMLIKEEGCL